MVKSCHKVLDLFPSDHTKSNFTKMDLLLGFAVGLVLSRDRNGQEGYIMYHGTTLQNALNILYYGFKPSLVACWDLASM